MTLQLAELFYQSYQTAKSELRLNSEMRDQLERSLLSIPLNLSEGSAKSSPKERRKFYRISLGSLSEVQCILRLVNHPDLIKEADVLGASLYCLCIRT